MNQGCICFLVFLVCAITSKAQTIELPVNWITQGLSNCAWSTSASNYTAIPTDNYNARCGPTCIEMVAAYYENKRQPSAQKIIDYIIDVRGANANIPCLGPSGNGFDYSEITNELNFLGLAATSYTNLNPELNSWQNCLSFLYDNLASDNLIIVNVRTSMASGTPNHWMVVVGIDLNNQEIIVNDPGKSSASSADHKRYSLSSLQSSWGTSGNRRCILVRSNKINDGLDIYAGSISNKKQIKIWFRLPGISNGTFSVQNCYIGSYNVSQSIINRAGCNGVGQFTIDFPNVQTSGLSNTNYDISFEIDGYSNRFRGAGQVYLLDPNTFADVPSQDVWHFPYVRFGIEEGFFKGIALGSNQYEFDGAALVTRGQAAKVVFMAANKLHLMEVNITGNVLQNLSPTHWAFPFMQSLYNYGVISDGRPDDLITTGQFAKMLVNALGLSTNDENDFTLRNGSGRTQSILVINSSDPTLQQYLEIVNKIMLYTSINSNRGYLEPAVNGLMCVSNVQLNGSLVMAVGSNTLSRDLMAKTIVNIYKYKRDKIGNYQPCYAGPQLLNIFNNNFGKFTVIGDKFELTSTPTGSINLSTGSATIDMEEGEVKDFGLDDETLNGYPLHFYWCVDSGQLVSLFPNNNHKKVRFTAPDVAAPTPVTLYLYIGCGNGMAKEAIYNITVYPTGQVPQPTAAEPTVSPSALGFSNTNYYQTDESWTSGNGDYTLVTYTPQGSTIYPPVDGEVYSSGSTISGNTKVTYNGTGNTDVTGSLQPGTTYQFRAYSFNGNTVGSTNYKTTNPASGSVTTLTVPPFNADFYWDDNPIVAGQSVEFTNTVNSSGVNESWTFQGGSPASSTLNNPDVTFASAGTYLVTLTATNTNTNQVSTVSKYVTVLAASAVNPDFVVSNVSLPATTLYAGQSGISTNITFSNIGLIDGQVNNYRIYLSSNTIYDAGDTQIGIRTGWASAEIAPGQALSTTHNVSIPGGTASGTWYILVYADFDNTNVEANEGNNVGSIQVNIQPALPDFVPNTLTLSRNTVATYDTLTVTSGIINTGYYESGFFSVSYYISSNNTFETTDTILSDCCYGVNGYDCYLTTYNFVDKIRIPPTVKSGNYYIIEVVDWSHGAYQPNQYAESNEVNNVKVTPITIANPSQPTLIPSNIRVTNITASSVKILCKKGSGTNRLIVVDENSNSFLWNIPTDGTAYSASTNYQTAGLLGTYANQGRIVYNGTDSTVTVTGLNQGKVYHINVFEFNSTGNGPNYLVENYNLPLFFRTLDSVPNTNTWKPVYAPDEDYRIQGIKFFNDSLGVMCAQSGQLFRTQDGGISWNTVFVEEGAYFYGLSFYGNSTGIAYTYGGSIYKTINGGLTWAKTFSQVNPPINFRKAVFTSASTIWIAGSGNYDGFNYDDTTGYILKSIDAGNSFQIVKQTTNRNVGIAFPTSSIGYVTTKFGKVHKTTDGGVTWNTITTNNRSTGLDVKFITATTGYVITGTHVLRTTNGCQSYDTLTSIVNGEDLTFYDDQTFYASGYLGDIKRTNDGGATWQNAPLTVNNGGTYNAFAFRNPNTLFAAGSEIYYSETGGLAYSIGKPTLSLNPICTGFSMQVSFAKTGTFNAGNVFTVQLSDSAGSFDAPLTIGSLVGVNAGTVTLSIPNGVKQSSTYRIRIVSSNPAATSSYSDNLTVYQTPAPSISALLPVQYNLASSPVTLSSYGNPSGGTFRINGNISTTINPATLGLGTHTVRYTIVNGSCVSSAEKAITITPVPVITITQPTPTTICPGSSITFTYTSESINAGNVFSVQLSDKFGNFTSPTVIYSFTGNNTSGSITAAIPVTAAKAAGYKIRMVASNPSVFSAGSNAFTIDTLLVPAVSVQATATNICGGQAVTFNASTQNAGTSPQYQWLLNNMPIGPNSSTYTISALNNQDEVSLVLTSSDQCALPAIVSSTPILMQVNSTLSPAVYIIAEDTVFCEGSPASFAAYPSNEGNTPTYEWKVNGLATGNNSAYFSSSSLVNGDKISVVLTSSEQCLSYATAIDSLYTNILPSVTPSISITKDNPDNCSNQLSNFTATFTNAGTNPVFVWKNNGQVVGTNNSTYDNVSLLGGEVITCELTSSLCASPNPVLSNTINILTTNSPAVIGQPQGAGTACVGDTVTYTASEGGSTTITWSVNNGAILSGQGTASVSILWQQAGNNAITVVGSNTCGSAIANQVKMVNVGAPAELTIALNNPTVCDDTSAIFYANVTNGGVSPIFQWLLNGLPVGSNSGTYTLANPATGDNIVCVLTAANSCSVHPTDTSNTIAVIVIPLPVTPSITMTPAVWCGNNPTYLETQPCSGCSYSWNQSFTIPFIGTTVLPISGNTNSIPINGITQGWNVNVTVTNTSGCSASSSTTFNATQYQNSASDISATICQNNPYNFNGVNLSASGVYTDTLTSANGCDSVVTLTLTVNPVSSYLINASICQGESYLFNNQNLTVEGTYTDTLSNAHGCDSVIILNLTVGAPPVKPVITITGDTAFCLGDSVVLQAVNTLDTLLWSTNATTPSITVNTSGIYHVQSNNQCGNSISDNLQITVWNLPAQPGIIQNGDTLTSTVTANGYQWYYNQSMLSGAVTQNIVASQNGNYELEITDANGCKNTSTVFNFTSVGVKDLTPFTIKIIPSPNNGNFTIQFSDNTPHQVVITDAVGRVLQEETITTFKQIANDIWANGVYFLNINSHFNTPSIKFVIAK